jgi:hypothetical protein
VLTSRISKTSNNQSGCAPKAGHLLSWQVVGAHSLGQSHLFDVNSVQSAA